MKIAKVSAKDASNPTSAKEPKPPANKATESYWMKKVKKPSGSANFVVRMMVGGAGGNFSLGTTNQKSAAKAAAKLWIDLKGGNVEQARKNLEDCRGSKLRTPTFRPESIPVLTIGTYIQQASLFLATRLEAETIYAYGCALRCIARESRSDRKLTCREAEQLPLASLTRSAVGNWREQRFKRESAVTKDPLILNRKKRTLNAIVRNASSLFSDELRQEVADRLEIEVPGNPFAEMKPLTVPINKYQSKIDIRTLIVAARERFRKPVSENTGVDAAAWIIFLLGFFSGLRSGETDRLQLHQIDLEKRLISVRETDCFKPKTQSSQADILIEAEVMAEIQWYIGQFPKGSKFMVCPEIPLPTATRGPERRRLNKPFSLLCHWLRNYEIDGSKPLQFVQKPIHELRKEAGSEVLRNNDIHQASLFLRHNNIQTTVNYYADSRSKKTVGLGHLVVS